MRFAHASMKQGRNIKQCGEALARLLVDAATVTEMDNGHRHFWGELQAGLGKRYSVHYIKQQTKEVNRSAEVGVVWRKRRLWRVVGEHVESLSPDLGQSSKGLDNARYMYVVTFGRRSLRSRKRIVRYKTIIATHWNGGLQDMYGNVRVDLPRVRWMAGIAAPVLQSTIAAQRRAGREVHVGMDSNYWTPAGGDKWKWAPGRIATRTGMAIASRHVDYLMWSRNMKQVGTMEVIKPGTDGNHSDHAWLIVDLRKGKR